MESSYKYYELEARRNDAFIVQHATKERIYKAFHDTNQFLIHQQFYPEKERCFYEVIKGNNAQKPHFDIDIAITDHTATNHEAIINDLIYCIRCWFVERSLEFNESSDILLYSSHGDKKFSYHLVINNWYHNNNSEARIFYTQITQSMYPFNASYVDRSVYSKLQHFRLLGSMKYGSNRTKVPVKFWNLFGSGNNKITFNTRSYNEEFNVSLISNTKGCTLLPLQSVEQERVINYEDFVDDEDISEILSMVPDCYEIGEPKDKYIRLNRIKPDFCVICNRIHDAENAFIEKDDNIYYLRCFRDTRKRHLIKIKTLQSVNVNTENVDQYPTVDTNIEETEYLPNRDEILQIMQNTFY